MTERYLPTSVFGGRHPAATCPHHHASEVQPMDTAPVQRAVRYETIAGFRISSSRLPTSSPHQQRVSAPSPMYALPLVHLPCHDTATVYQPDSATSPDDVSMTSSDLDPTNEVMLTSSQKGAKLLKIYIMAKNRVFTFFFIHSSLFLPHALASKFAVNLLNRPGDLQRTSSTCIHDLCSLFYQVFLIVCPLCACNSLLNSLKA